MLIHEHHLPLEGCYNFRDLGGIKTIDGDRIKEGKIFRSDNLDKLTDKDLKYLCTIPLISIVDFRSSDEVKAAPDILPASVKGYYELNIAPGNLNKIQKSITSLTPEQIDTAMMSMNKLLVTDPVNIQQYKSFFDLVQNPENTPLVFHCTAGKDRTGMGAFLFLSSLGVSEKQIFDNYLLSNNYLNDKYASYIAQYPSLKPLFGVKREWLKAGIEQIKKDYLSVENYLSYMLHVNSEQMKELYLR